MLSTLDIHPGFRELLAASAPLREFMALAERHPDAPVPLAMLWQAAGNPDGLAPSEWLASGAVDRLVAGADEAARIMRADCTGPGFFQCQDRGADGVWASRAAAAWYLLDLDPTMPPHVILELSGL
jgi:hypothetical protein